MDFLPQNQPFQFGRSTYSNGEKYGPIKQEHLTISLILAGELSVRADDQTYRFFENQVFFIYSEKFLEIIYPRNQIHQTMWCHTGELTLNKDAKARLSSLPVSLPPSKLLRILFDEGAKLGHGSNINLARLRNSLGTALINEYIYQAHLEEEEHDLPPAVWQTKKYLEEHFHEQCSLDDVALAVDLNPRYLIQLFKKHIGMTPIKYLWHLRGENAINLLLQSGLTVSEIGYRCGFQTPHHFSRFIKEHYQHTPKEIRSNAWQRDPLNLED